MERFGLEGTLKIKINLLPWARLPLHQIRLPRALSNPVLNATGVGASTKYLGSLCCSASALLPSKALLNEV